MEIIYCNELRENIIDKIKAENNTYWSESKKAFLVAAKMRNNLFKKYNLSDDDYMDSENYVYWFSLQEWFECVYEQLDFKFMGTSYEYCDYIEAVMKKLNSIINNEMYQSLFANSKDWAYDLDKYLKMEMSKQIETDLQDNLKNAEENGFKIIL